MDGACSHVESAAPPCIFLSWSTTAFAHALPRFHPVYPLLCPSPVHSQCVLSLQVYLSACLHGNVRLFFPTPRVTNACNETGKRSLPGSALFITGAGTSPLPQCICKMLQMFSLKTAHFTNHWGEDKQQKLKVFRMVWIVLGMEMPLL